MFSIFIKKENEKRLKQSIETAMKYGDGLIMTLNIENGDEEEDVEEEEVQETDILPNPNDQQPANTSKPSDQQILKSRVCDELEENDWIEPNHQ